MRRRTEAQRRCRTGPHVRWFATMDNGRCMRLRHRMFHVKHRRRIRTCARHTDDGLPRVGERWCSGPGHRRRAAKTWGRPATAHLVAAPVTGVERDHPLARSTVLRDHRPHPRPDEAETSPRHAPRPDHTVFCRPTAPQALSPCDAPDRASERGGLSEIVLRFGLLAGGAHSTGEQEHLTCSSRNPMFHVKHRAQRSSERLPAPPEWSPAELLRRELPRVHPRGGTS